MTTPAPIPLSERASPAPLALLLAVVLLAALGGVVPGADRASEPGRLPAAHLFGPLELRAAAISAGECGLPVAVRRRVAVDPRLPGPGHRAWALPPIRAPNPRA